MGRSEQNALLGSRFGGRATAIKTGAVAGTLVLQAWLRHKHPEASRPFAIANFATGAALGGLAVRNWRVTRR